MYDARFVKKSHRIRARYPFLLLLVLPILLYVFGCSSDEDNTATGPGPVTQVSTCLDCHSDQATLIATAEPDTTGPPEDTGEG